MSDLARAIMVLIGLLILALYVANTLYTHFSGRIP